MVAKEERRTLQEQVGVSINASVLRTEGRNPNVETPLLQVAALGAAALEIHHGTERSGRTLAVVVADPKHRPEPVDVVASRLASILVHLGPAGDEAQIAEAVRLYAAWMGFKVRFRVYADRAELLPRLAALALHESMSNHCTRCGGTGRLEVVGGGKLVRGQGRMQRNAVFRACPAHQGCGGSGKSVPSQTLRRQMLSMTHERYTAERWDLHCNAAVIWLEREVRRINRPLTAQLERSKKRV